MQDNNEKSVEELRIKVERVELESRLRRANSDQNANPDLKDREALKSYWFYKSASTLQGLTLLSSINLMFLLIGITILMINLFIHVGSLILTIGYGVGTLLFLLVQFIIILITKPHRENKGFKIAAAVCTFLPPIGSILAIIYARCELNHYK